MLRSPTVFEDLVKMICTTNCSWSLTEKMVTGLVQSLGRESDDGRKSFPTPGAMALMPVKFYVDEVRAGYRAPYLKELADRVAIMDHGKVLEMGTVQELVARRFKELFPDGRPGTPERPTE